MRGLLITVAFVGLCVATGLTAGSGIDDPKTADHAAEKQKLVALQQERLEVLHDIVEEMEARYRTGMISYQPVSQATIEWLNADLDLAGDRAARISIRKLMVAHLRKVENGFLAEVGVGPGKNCDVLGARATRLQAEVELLREEMSDKSK